MYEIERGGGKSVRREEEESVWERERERERGEVSLWERKEEEESGLWS